MKLKYILVGILAYFGYLLYRAEEHFIHLVEVNTAELDY
jgi:hypothetical protein